MKDVYQSLLDFVAIFNKLELRYAVMGGIAVRAYSIPRATWDVDLVVALDRESLPSFFNAVEEQGYTVPESYLRGWVDQVAEMPLVKFRTYFSGGSVDVDVFLAEKEFQKELLARSQMLPTEVGPISVVSAEDLILLKLMAKRPRDMIDVADLLFIQGEMDEEYMKRWGARLGVLQVLQDQLDHRPTERP